MSVSRDVHQTSTELKKFRHPSSTTRIVPIDTRVSISSDGPQFKARASAVEWTNDNEGSISAARVGGNIGLSLDGVKAGFEGKAVWAEQNLGPVNVGAGLNVDTGMKWSGDGMKASVLGWGLQADNNGVGIKTPFCNITFN
ncbi:hypothetical protein GCK72_015638 [Caenorhabditis remanei]|uniref:Uncharacterized protein n=1 Tax=Caenorhabditis remanei TaxID=31234 RepID=A0A6A5GVJ5_CAERE|nr:hypothetical protein GCK72_015638 [Caenorhabditis remanei]KAF1759177.1 hypothetical protein GCK72_015638 [Caenorhabditis remanei]